MFCSDRAKKTNHKKRPETLQEHDMTTKAPAEAKPKNEQLAANYRPLGLKAVIAAALMLKRKPAAKVA
jgi:hypothetical protein